MEKPSSGHQWDNASASWAPILFFEPHISSQQDSSEVGDPAGFNVGCSIAMWTEDMPLCSGARDLTASRGVPRQGLSVWGTGVLSESILLESCPGKSKPPLQGLLGEAGLLHPPLLSLLWPACCHLYRATVFFAHTGVLIILYLFFCNCRIIKYFNFKVSNFLLHT